jgi:hypothetical protein
MTNAPEQVAPRADRTRAESSTMAQGRGNKADVRSNRSPFCELQQEQCVNWPCAVTPSVVVTTSLHAPAVSARNARVVLVGLVEPVQCSTGRANQRADAGTFTCPTATTRNRSAGGSKPGSQRTPEKSVGQSLFRSATRHGTRVVVARSDVRC